MKKDLEKDSRDLERENRELNRQNATLTKKEAQLSDQVDRLKDQVEHLREHNKDQLDRLKEQVEDLRQHNKELYKERCTFGSKLLFTGQGLDHKFPCCSFVPALLGRTGWEESVERGGRSNSGRLQRTGRSPHQNRPCAVGPEA